MKQTDFIPYENHRRGGLGGSPEVIQVNCLFEV